MLTLPSQHWVPWQPQMEKQGDRPEKLKLFPAFSPWVWQWVSMLTVHSIDQWDKRTNYMAVAHITVAKSESPSFVCCLVQKHWPRAVTFQARPAAPAISKNLSQLRVLRSWSSSIASNTLELEPRDSSCKLSSSNPQPSQWKKHKLRMFLCSHVA